MRGLSPRFMDDLKNGLLAPILERVTGDHTLCLEIRDDYVNIYYRGGNLLKVSCVGSGYEAFFDVKYAKGDREALSGKLPGAGIRRAAEVDAWIMVMPELKQAMDMFLGRRPKEEREAQQLLVRDNNFARGSRQTDYFICDIEYANANGRFDMVAVHWPSDPITRKNPCGRRLVLVEVKYGDGAIAGSAGVHSHISDINEFLSRPAGLQGLKDEMIGVLNQKRDLGLIDCGKDLAGFSDEPPMLLLVLANHDPGSSILRASLESLPPSPHADLYLAGGCFMGYGLFDQAIIPINDALNRPDDRI